MGVHVGPGVLGLAGLEEDVGDDLVDLADELEEGVLRQVLEGELSLRGVSRVLHSSAPTTLRNKDGTYGLSEDGVAVTGDDLARLEGRPDVLGDLVVRRGLADLGAHLLEPSEDLLVGKAACVSNHPPSRAYKLPVEGTGETVERSAEREEGVREGRADQVASVGLPVSHHPLAGLLGLTETLPPSWSEWMVM